MEPPRVVIRDRSGNVGRQAAQWTMEKLGGGVHTAACRWLLKNGTSQQYGSWAIYEFIAVLDAALSIDGNMPPDQDLSHDKWIEMNDVRGFARGLAKMREEERLYRLTKDMHPSDASSNGTTPITVKREREDDE